ncbi:MAG: PEGA domain-containing protein [Candidatus Marinimicrobia bacterium]|nr:PEGA domain-containing protein [Candidatus Neomarinimicrobiota bacterium]
MAILSNPSGAEVFINGLPQEKKTNFFARMKAGTYTIELVKEGYDSWKETVEVYGNTGVSAELVPVGAAKKDEEVAHLREEEVKSEGEKSKTEEDEPESKDRNKKGSAAILRTKESRTESGSGEPEDSTADDSKKSVGLKRGIWALVIIIPILIVAVALGGDGNGYDYDCVDYYDDDGYYLGCY